MQALWPHTQQRPEAAPLSLSLLSLASAAYTSKGKLVSNTTVTSGRSPQDGHLRTVTSGRSPQDGHLRTITSGWSPQDGHLRTVTSGRSPQDGHLRTVTSGRTPQDGHLRTVIQWPSLVQGKMGCLSSLGFYFAFSTRETHRLQRLSRPTLRGLTGWTES